MDILNKVRDSNKGMNSTLIMPKGSGHLIQKLSPFLEFGAIVASIISLLIITILFEYDGGRTYAWYVLRVYGR